jgi:hypothetical protein
MMVRIKRINFFAIIKNSLVQACVDWILAKSAKGPRRQECFNNDNDGYIVTSYWRLGPLALLARV